MKRYHLKPTAIKTACIRTIPLLLFFFCVVLFIAAAETHDAPRSKSSAEPTANGDWPEAFFNAAHTGNNRYETQLNRYNVGNLTQLWASQSTRTHFTLRR